MADIRHDLKEIAQELKTQRDRLALKIHLGKAEVVDEWRVLERKWERFSANSQRIKEELGETMDDVTEDLHDLADDLREGYSRIKKLLH